MDLECPYQKPAESPAPVSSSSLSVPAPHQPTKDESSQSGLGKAEVFCSSQQMNVALPAGSISEVIVKGLYTELHQFTVEQKFITPGFRGQRPASVFAV